MKRLSHAQNSKRCSKSLSHGGSGGRNSHVVVLSSQYCNLPRERWKWIDLMRGGIVPSQDILENIVARTFLEIDKLPKWITRAHETFCLSSLPPPLSTRKRNGQRQHPIDSLDQPQKRSL
jgi:hypothetical protein